MGPNAAIMVTPSRREIFRNQDWQLPDPTLGNIQHRLQIPAAANKQAPRIGLMQLDYRGLLTSVDRNTLNFLLLKLAKIFGFRSLIL